jgi:biopolymer transport protein ExbD
MRYFEVRKPRIEIIPMIDIMLFLLVFFLMLTLTMIPSSGLLGKLPASSTGQTLPVIKVLVEIHPDGSLVVDRTPMNLDQFKIRLQELGRAGNEPVALTLAGEATTPLQELIRVMDACRQSGMTQIGISTQAPR